MRGLVDMIVDQASGKAELLPAGYDEIMTTLKEESLQVEYHHDEDRNTAYRRIRRV